jgi:hypothetical protein
MEEREKIELRSEKTRNLIGKMPSYLIRNGMTVVFVVMVLLLIGTYFIPYPDTVYVEIKIISRDCAGKTFKGMGLIPYQYIASVNEGMKIIVELEGYTKSEYNSVEGIINVKENKIIEHNGQNHFPIQVTLHGNEYMLVGMRADGEILTLEKTVFERLFHKW